MENYVCSYVTAVSHAAGIQQGGRPEKRRVQPDNSSSAGCNRASLYPLPSYDYGRPRYRTPLRTFPRRDRSRGRKNARYNNTVRTYLHRRHYCKDTRSLRCRAYFSTSSLEQTPDTTSYKHDDTATKLRTRYCMITRTVPRTCHAPGFPTGSENPLRGA